MTILSNLYCGLVEDNLDPEKIGRIKIRIPGIHGSNPDSKSYTTTKNLNWAYPSMPFYSAYDCGSFIVPPVGCYVWAMQVAGDNPYWVYFGGVPGNGPKMPKPMNSLTNDNENISMGKYYTPVGESEIPVDLKNLEDAQSGVIFKSQKGHTVKYSDQDENEFFEIIDRSGQSIKLECPVSKEENVANMSRRGNSNTHDGGSIKITSGDATIIMENGNIILCGKSIRLISDNTSVEL